MTGLFSIILICFGSVLIVLLFIGRLRRSLPASGPLLATLIGIGLGPVGLGIVDTSDATADPPRLLEEASRMTLALTVMSTALRIPGYSWKLVRATGAMLLVAVPLMALTGTALAWGLWSFSIPMALCLGGCLAPTDPVLASSVVTGDVAIKGVPARLRHLISSEAAANDGLALLFVLGPVLWLKHSPGEAAEQWIVHVLLWEVIAGGIIGWVVGDVAGRVMRQAARRAFTADVSLFAVSVALALTVLGLLRVLQADGILGVLFAGLAYSRISHPQSQARTERTQEAARTLIEIFVLFGMAIPCDRWVDLGWTGILFAVLVLLFRRMPWIPIAAKLSGFFKNLREVFFNGWFGPIGVAAIFYSLLADRRMPEFDTWPIVSLVVMASVAVHGTTATFATRRLKWTEGAG